MPKYTARRRQVMKNGDNVSHLEVFERDKWICSLCFEKIDRELRFPDMMAATIDHVIPVSRGGRHEMANIQSAHRLCNEKKGDSIDGIE
jgi:5-methylcytosine-specific restriction endonuclease McrA